MANTRSKRTADTTEPAPAEPTKKRQPKRAKKASAALEPKPVEADAAAEHAETDSIQIETPEISTEVKPTESQPNHNVAESAPALSEGEEETEYADTALDEPRASDLYLDTVGIRQLSHGMLLINLRLIESSLTLTSRKCVPYRH